MPWESYEGIKASKRKKFYRYIMIYESLNATGKQKDPFIKVKQRPLEILGKVKSI